MKKGILLVNLGTPDSPSVKDVRRFLREFLMDPLVLDIPVIARWLLVHCIIAPFRGPKSATEYQRLWTAQGSPLKIYTTALSHKLSERLGEEYNIAMAMRYQKPDIHSALQKLRAAGTEQLLIVPLFPQYAEATTVSVLNKVSTELKNIDWLVKTKNITYFATDENYIGAVVSRVKTVNAEKIDHTIFSYHGLPERQLKKRNEQCLMENCCADLNEQNQLCYRAQCFATSRALAEKMELSEQQYTVCFQSRQGNIPWIRPYIDDVIREQAKSGAKHLMILSPAFVADCLETIVEIGHTYRKLFKDCGGDDLVLIPSLNDSNEWLDALENIINKYIEDDYKTGKINHLID